MYALLPYHTTISQPPVYRYSLWVPTKVQPPKQELRKRKGTLSFIKIYSKVRPVAGDQREQKKN